MVLYSLTFYLFSSVAVLSALMVISAKNPVHSVLFLILSFVNASGLFVLLGAEFFGNDPRRCICWSCCRPFSICCNDA